MERIIWKHVVRWGEICLFLAFAGGVHAQVQANFMSDTTMGCEQLSVQFTNTSTGDPTTFQWDFGDGRTSSVENPSIVYLKTGTYRVSLTVSDSSSMNTKVAYISVYSNPKVDYSTSLPVGCPSGEVGFVDHSEAGSGEIVSRVWDFGDGSNFGSGSEVSHTYDAPGDYQARLVVTNSMGCTSTAANETVTIGPTLTPDFSANQSFSCSAPFNVMLTANDITEYQDVTYQWDFGDGSPFGNGRSISHTYSKEGRFPVTLTVFVDNGCEASTSKADYIAIGTYPADFTYSKACLQDVIMFQNTSSPRPHSAIWQFGDGHTASGVDAHHRFTNTGSYEVTLINDYGDCKDTIVNKIEVLPSPSADFQSATRHYCGVPGVVTFENLSTGGVSWKWDFGDGAISSERNPSHTYRSNGHYDVSLITFNREGCSDTMRKTAYIHIEAPDLSFTALPPEGCIPLPVTFSLPEGTTEDIQQFQWDFGDGAAASTEAAPTHTYQEVGNFSVHLEVVTKTGCTFSMDKEDFIRTGTKPRVNFEATPTEICLNEQVQFTNLSSPKGDSWEWEFPDNGDSILTVENPTFRFNHVQDQDVTLTIGNNGCYQSLTKADFIKIRPPEANFDLQLISCDDPTTFQFTDKSKAAEQWEWDFGDGDRSSTPNPKHSYARNGAYKVTLTVSNGSCTSRKEKWLQVIDEDIQLTVSDATLCLGDSVTISASPFYSNQFEWSLTWFSGDGRAETVQHIEEGVNGFKQAYQTTGTFTPTLKVQYVNGCYDSIAATPIRVQGPVADFRTSSAEICQGTSVTFDDRSQTDPASATIRQWIWDFGDGNSDTTQSGAITHSYQDAGQFRARLRVTDTNGCSDDTVLTKRHSITVNPGQASFSAIDTILCAGKKVRWQNTSDAGIGAAYLWDFGDGTTSDVALPDQKSYLKDAWYTVSLIVNTSKGCTDTLVRPDYIRVATPKAVMRDNQAVKECRIYQDTAISLSRNAQSILWEFGDGTTSTSDTAYHIYNVPGRYIQRLTVTGYGEGCTDVIEREIIITGPKGEAVVSETAGCGPFTVQFSAVHVEGASSFQWYFGDGAVSDPMPSTESSYTYPYKGLYHPALKLIDDTGCYVIVPFNDSINIVVDSIAVTPQYSWPLICDSNTVAFTPEGLVYSKDVFDQPAQYRWDFGDADQGTSDEENPQYRFRAPGTYNGLLNVRSAYGCQSEIPFSVTVPDSIPLKAAVAATPIEICSGETVQLTASSNVGTSYEWITGGSLDRNNEASVEARPESSTHYEVIAYSNNYCQADTAAITVTVHDLPEISAGPDIHSGTGSVIQLGATAEGNTMIQRWSWTPEDYLSCAHCITPVSTPRGNITYVVEGEDQFGCKGTDTVQLFLTCDQGKVFIPNTFTPNNDGVNDLFYPRGEGVKTVRYFRIYSRNGQLIYERTNFALNDRSSAWDGRFKGHLLDPGVFVYTISMVCDNNKIFDRNGDITLIR